MKEKILIAGKEISFEELEKSQNETNNYYIVYPIEGSAGTRNPCHGYDMMSSENLEFMQEVLKNRKKENPKKFKKAFLADLEGLKKLLNFSN